jgi:hypothetical protein
MVMAGATCDAFMFGSCWLVWLNPQRLIPLLQQTVNLMHTQVTRRWCNQGVQGLSAVPIGMPSVNFICGS